MQTIARIDKDELAAPVIIDIAEAGQYVLTDHGDHLMLAKPAKPAERSEDKPIFSYSRQEALADGVLHAVPEDLSTDAGIHVPVALTAAVYNQAVAVPPCLDGLQNETGRLWDILVCARLAMAQSPDECRAEFSVRVKTEEVPSGQRLRLHAHIGPGDTRNPVITIMYPEES